MKKNIFSTITYRVNYLVGGLSLTTDCSVLQAEICTIREAAEIIKHNDNLLGDVISTQVARQLLNI